MIALLICYYLVIVGLAIGELLVYQIYINMKTVVITVVGLLQIVWGLTGNPTWDR